MSGIIDYSGAGFTVTFDTKGVRGYVSINMEMYRDADALKGTGKYCIYCLHPWHGSCYFTIESNNKAQWFSGNAPEFIKQSFIDWIVDNINRRYF